MHDLIQIREDLENFKKSLNYRNSKIDFDQILDLDKKNRLLIQEKEKFEMEKKNISKSKDETLFEKSKQISNEIENLSKKQKIIKYELDNLLSSIPNLPWTRFLLVKMKMKILKFLNQVISMISNLNL